MNNWNESTKLTKSLSGHLDALIKQVNDHEIKITDILNLKT